MNETSLTIRSGRYGRSLGGDRAGVRALDHGHPRVRAQAVVELAVGDVERRDVLRSALQQAVGEAAGGGADVQRVAAGDVDLQRVERVGELDAAARDVGRRAVDVELDLRVDELPGLLRPAPSRAEVDLPRDHGGGGAGPRLEEPAFRQKGVQAHAGHGHERYRAALKASPPAADGESEMRLVLATLLVLLAVPASASAQTPLPPLGYAAPTASIARGAPLTFAVRTTAPAGSVVVRVSGHADVDALRPADGRRGHLAGRDRRARRRRPADLERPRELRAAPAAGPLLLAGLPDRRGRHRRRAADRPRAGARGHAADGRSRPRQAVPALRPPRRRRASICPPRTSRTRVTGARFKKLGEGDRVALGPEGAALDDRRGGRRRTASASPASPRRCRAASLGVQTDFIKRGQRDRERPRAARRRELGRGPGLSRLGRGRPRERAAARARAHGRQQEAPSRAARTHR